MDGTAAQPDVAAAEVLDAAYERLAGFRPEYAGGLADHAPMVAESLVHVGRADAVPAWLDHYVGRLERRDGASRAGESGAGERRVGDPASFDAWLAWYSGRLAGDAAEGWRTLLDAELAVLAPGLVGAAGHGILRVAHAARALAVVDTPPRRHELASGLAYLAASAQRLPGDPRPAGRLSPLDALARMPHHPDPDAWFISTALESLAAADDLPAAVDAADPAHLGVGPIVAAVAELAAAHEVPGIVWCHAMTVPASLRSLAGLVSAPVGDDLLRYGWQAVAGLVAAYPPGDAVPTPRAPDPQDLIDAALATGDEHHVKLAVAAAGEHTLSGDDTVLAGAAHVISRITARF